MASNDRCPRAGNYHQLILVGLLSLFVNPVQADWVAGVTSDVDTHGVGGVVEYHWRDFATVGGLSGNIAVAGRIDGDGDAFAGAGVAGRYRFDGGFFIEGSFMPGLYRDGDTDLGARCISDPCSARVMRSTTISQSPCPMTICPTAAPKATTPVPMR